MTSVWPRRSRWTTRGGTESWCCDVDAGRTDGRTGCFQRSAAGRRRVSTPRLSRDRCGMCCCVQQRIPRPTNIFDVAYAHACNLARAPPLRDLLTYLPLDRRELSVVLLGEMSPVTLSRSRQNDSCRFAPENRLHVLKQDRCAIAKMTARCADKSKQTATPPPKIT